MEKSSNKLVDLSVSFAVEILNLVKYLKQQRETIISNQIGRAGTQYRSKYSRSSICSRQSRFYFKTSNRLKRSQRNQLLVVIAF